jgi:hypothetical protein
VPAGQPLDAVVVPAWRRAHHHLDANRYAGLKTLYFPDNSVVCHAAQLPPGDPRGMGDLPSTRRRRRKLIQTFSSGAYAHQTAYSQ